MKILVINCGSSSLKYQLIESKDGNVLAKGLAERIGINDSLLTHNANGEKIKIKKDMKDHKDAIKLVLDALVNSDYGVIKDMSEIDAVGHRVVHGGEYFTSSVLITDDVLKAITDCIELAPLHNPANIEGIKACKQIMPDVPMVAVFDTAFHQTMPDYAYLYPIPYEYYTKYKIRKYGFHGTSHKYVSQRAAEILNKPIESLKIITCHLGNGSSIAAVKNGKSIDTSMGFTPLEGLAMGTRSGSIDPSIISYLMEKENISAEEVVNILNKKSGVYGISGISSDFRDLEDAAFKNGDKRAQLALNVFAYRVKKTIGSYAAAMGGVDVIVFTAGIGENGPEIREFILDGLEFLGFKLDKEKNKVRGEEAIISTADSKVNVMVVPTNEEYMIAKDTEKIVESLK
ncbi:acetate kinase [Thermoanaerobacterium thermosaccharolyticum]|uniref:Acetate kinase n=3 Tax=Thermoanaerobacterium thermosaccharolyticum TaxID=1517 RepID=ACKA_THETC|nr:acetate kinase [Thermoanaerobacterium thermosaccharolyticum]Q59331.2 RecName: Full=Acetate kinase; AltName: Full=Acetokinase [Thermoanaerobacterium thermosaccharolyticum DSM 571]TCW38729.1 acetate kinase [Thermohydrogenium kirishiense]ADL69011.1 acetate kinase [Thermoanaerobacterium thermosaccharolyticum DSM 571]AGB19108.1 acetate kinase [Thermoanaerobacterium thermosaccharolyticum M0795]AST58944.1 acetate kinase [Thermoanaerobacterium thermosaccharolyticum]KAA5806107.1 acetate kinase [The